jgi:hypothetical protein
MHGSWKDNGWRRYVTRALAYRRRYSTEGFEAATVRRYLKRGTEAGVESTGADGTSGLSTSFRGECTIATVIGSWSRLLGRLTLLLPVVCCSRAQHATRRSADFRLRSLHPHARAAGTPTGRSLFCARAVRFCAQLAPSSCLSDLVRRVGWNEGEEKKEIRKSKKGAGASPLFIIDAPKPVPESRFGSGHPGKPIFFKVAKRRASVVPAYAQGC